ncbi:Metalloendopeptidase OMA1, mitochondrial [Frankliniella fusca]|uniref:Metalloendopeptidase OMA1, mitochondrial n=1 Tax=Frankliniella fusca TaxID=407009 RepID=A0AAE1L7F0_9NEOP|nr:Metalloendopeptidase OMA1, mitochondrial [Frankliniella fusca]
MASYKTVYSVAQSLRTHCRLQLYSKPLPSTCLRTRYFQDIFYKNKFRPAINKQQLLVPRALCYPKKQFPLLGFQNSASRISDSILFQPIQCRLFHTSQSRKAIPPVVWLIFRPIANIAAVIFGRIFKKAWKRLSPEKRDKIISRLKRNRSKILGAAGALTFGLLLYILVHLEEAPYSKRKRFILFSRQDMRNLCVQAEQEILSDFGLKVLPSSHPLSRTIVRVMAQIMEANHQDIVDSGVTSWNIYVLDEPDISNAMVLPNGTVFVFSGIANTCSSDDQLGAVLAHEVAHVLLNHQAESLSKEHLSSFIFLFILTAIWAVLPDLAAFFSTFFASNCSQIFISLPFSRLMESEADAVGLNLAAKACLDVREASVFWAKMALREELGCEEAPMEILSSHPSHETRQKAIDELIPNALKLRESCARCKRLTSSDPRVRFNLHKLRLKEAKSKGCLSCETIFSYYNV